MAKPAIESLASAYQTIEELLRDFRKSPILQDYFAGQYCSLFFGNVIQNIFQNLNNKNISDLRLKRGQISKIRREYSAVAKKARAAISMSLQNEVVGETFYNHFRTDLLGRFPDCVKIVESIEQEIGYAEAKLHLKRRMKEMSGLGMTKGDLGVELKTVAMEQFIAQNGRMPSTREIERIMKKATMEMAPEISKVILKQLKKGSRSLLEGQADDRRRFEARLYRRWRGAIDLLECLIKVSIEAGEKLQERTKETDDPSKCFKREALTKLHARALHISNEILILLKAGYADGANARWRSLHELAIISLFLLENDDEVAQRYLDHADIKTFKEAKDYRSSYKKLGYPPLQVKEFNAIKRQRDNLIINYGKDFGENDWNWIPDKILTCRNFRELEKKVKLGHWHPFYNSSCDSVHGGAKGFYRISLMDELQGKVHLVGPSNYGLADVLMNASVSLLHVTYSLLKLDADFDDLVSMWVIYYFAMEIKEKAPKIQSRLEEDERKILVGK